MPYIPQTQRHDIHCDLLIDGADFVPENAGELNFLISTFIENYIARNGISYAVLNEMVGALECAKMELNRVVIGPYEDKKILENGRVYSATAGDGSY
jgi:hypothetical protein